VLLTFLVCSSHSLVLTSSCPLLFLQSIINAVNSNAKATWVAGVNEKFQGMTTAQAARLMGTLREGPHYIRARMSADPWVAPKVGAM
jgi:hypothetical protein